MTRIPVEFVGELPTTSAGNIAKKERRERSAAADGSPLR